jgi:prenylated cyclic peptide (anacyclamide/piricyclamide family)
MTKKNIRPQQVAPVQRETTAQSSKSREGGMGSSWLYTKSEYEQDEMMRKSQEFLIENEELCAEGCIECPFAADDAE